MKNIFKYKIKGLAMLFMLAGLIFLSGCDDEEGSSGEVVLNSYGPSPVMRGAQLRFIGTNLDKVTAIVLPGAGEITSFETKTPTLIVVAVPDPTVNGQVTLRTAQGDINAKTLLGIAEPITIASISPAAARPGSVVTIEGTYLNLVTEVIFMNKKSVTEFESQSRESLTLVVPEDAETGTIIVSDGEEEPNLIESEMELQVILPAVTTLTPNPVKAGSTLTIAGTDLDLVKDITFAGGVRVTSEDFDSQSAGEIVMQVPDDINDGGIVLRPASAVEVAVAESLNLVAPAITSFAPNPGKNGAQITITGTNLDLVTSVVFGGDKTGTIDDASTETSLVVSIPADATEGTFTLNTENDPVESDDELTLVKPTVTSIAPLSVNTVDAPSITITGTHLDLVKTVVFGGDWEADIADATTASATQITIPVTPGSVSGLVTIVTTNGTEVVSAQSLTIVPDVPEVDGPAIAYLGSMLTLTGTNMSVIADIYFPGDLVATKFGAKTPTSIEVFVPKIGVPSGIGKIKFVTFKNEVYYSPEIDFKGLAALAVTIFDETSQSPFGQGGGWGGTTDDFANTENVRNGSVAVKTTFGGDWGGGCQFGTWGSPEPLSTAGTTIFAFSIFGGAGSEGKEVNVNVGGTQAIVVVKEGEWKDVEIPLSSVGSPASIGEIWFQDRGWTGTVYIDYIGLR